MSAVVRDRTLRPAVQQRFRVQYGPWALVTGASDGIGRAFAQSLAGAGLNLVLVARRAELLEDLAADLTRRCGVQTRVVATDLSRPSGGAQVVAATADLDLGLLVAAAGFGSAGAFLAADLDTELAMLDLNCGAVLRLAHHFGGRFAGQRRGAIVLMSSLFAFQGVPGAAHYAATKAYVQTLAEGLRAELAASGVEVLACAPGPVHSGFAARAQMRMGLALRPGEVAHATLNALGRRGTIRPGWLSVLLEGSLAPLPRAARTRIMARVMAGMLRHA